MRPEFHERAFEERKDTIFQWAIDVRGIENSQRIIGDNASKAITELLSAVLHKHHKVEEGFQLNHSWFKSENVSDRLPPFEHKSSVVAKMIQLERVCKRLAYGTPKPVEETKSALALFIELEEKLKRMLT